MPESITPPDDPWPAALWERFVAPRDEDRPRAWWHWMDSNIDPAGIVRDLTWLHSVGVRGVQMFEGGMGMPLVVPEPVRPGSETWDEAIRTAAETSSALGLELAVATSAGWSAAGGPWIEPMDAMKKVVWSETVVDGGPVDIALPELPGVAGLYQDAPRWAAAAREPWSVDWRVLAFPDAPAFEPLVPSRLTACVSVESTAVLTDGSFVEAISLPRNPEEWSEAWLAQEFAEPVTVSSIVLGLPGPRGFGAAPPADAALESSEDGVRYREVARLPASALPARTASFTPVTARWFRVTLSAGSAADALPPTAEGVRHPPILRTADAFLVSEFALRTAALIHRAETKAGFGVERDYYAVDTDARGAEGLIPPAQVIDLTGHLRDGRLTWDAPPGRWRILRLGASLTGQTNGPAPADATGLEVDKLDGDRVRTYLGRYLERFEARPGNLRAAQ